MGARNFHLPQGGGQAPAPQFDRRSAFDKLRFHDCPTAHRGLLLDKFVERQEPKEDRAGQRLIETVCNRAWKKNEDAAYQAAFDRWRALWQQRVTQLQAFTVELDTEAPLAIGHGAKGVLDGGVRLHRVYGLPLIPGSSLRGAMSAFANAVLGEQQPEKWSAGRDENRENNLPAVPQGEYHRLLFGDTDQAGLLCVEDAWWVPRDGKYPLRRDVLTPHHQKYYTGAPRQEPADTDEPVPVTIPVAQGQFLFVLHLRPLDAEQRQAATGWLPIAGELLTGMLAHQGVGAKRSQGYGRFKKASADPATARPTTTDAGSSSSASEPLVRMILGYEKKAVQLIPQLDAIKFRLDKLPTDDDREAARKPLAQVLGVMRQYNRAQFDKALSAHPWLKDWVGGA